MRVLAISHSYVAAENQKNLDALAKRCHVCAIVPHFIPETVFKRLDADPATPRLLVFRRISFPRAQYLLLTFDMGMRKFKPDIIHIEYDPWSMIFWQMTFCRILFARDAKVVCTVKKNTYRKLPWLIGHAKNVIAKIFIYRVDYFVAVSQRVKTLYKENFDVPDSRITVVQHLGVDPYVFHPTTDRGFNRSECIVGYCGRFDANKGVIDLLEVVSALNKEGHAKIRLKLLGHGPLLNDIRAFDAPWLDVIDPIPHAQVAGFMRTLDVFVMPSHITPDHEEHDGHALMEALACGIACVGSTSGIIPELLGQGAGLVFTAGNKEELKQRLLSLATSEELRTEIAHRAAEQAISLFTLDGIANLKTDIYRNCIV